MKKLEIFILTILSVIFIGGIFTTVTAQTPQLASNKSKKIQIHYTSLSELIGSDNEIECFSHYFDMQPDSVSRYIDDVRQIYEDEIRNAGYKVTEIENHIHYPVLFTRFGHMVKWEDLSDYNRHEWKLVNPKAISKLPNKTIKIED